MSAEHVTRRRPGPSLEPARRLRLAVVEGPDRGATIEHDRAAAASVGVAPDNSLVLADHTVSRYHLELYQDHDGIHVTDLGSLNGTFAGDVRLRNATVPVGTRLRLGDTVVELQEGDPADEPAREEAPSIPGMVAASRGMQRVAGAIAELGVSDVAVLVQGETGTGKEVVARALHAASPRSRKPFEVVDCGALPPALIASELFGHERGAFTGADRRRSGAFERADGGTLFLDEIGELPLQVQPVLLGALERRRFRRVGGDREVEVDVRVVSATHRDLRTAVNDGSFRADLYYRLAVARIALPPLRERPEDIEPLVRLFVADMTGDPEAGPFGDAAIEALRRHPWSGNVRELRNVVESALAMGRLQVDSPPTPDAEDGAGEETGPIERYRDARAEALASFERRYLARLMEACDGNASEAARQARMDRKHLLTLLRKHELR